MEKGKRNTIIIAVTAMVIIAFLIAGMFIVPRVFYTKSFGNLVGNTSGGINKIVLSNGNTGETVEITNQTEIDNVYGLFKNTKYRVNWDQRPRDGFHFGINIYKNDKEYVIFNERIYSVNKAINEEALDDLFTK